MAPSPPPKGLPGFLRRSLRNPYDDPSIGGIGSASGEGVGERYGPSSSSAAAAAGTATAEAVTLDTEPASEASESDGSTGGGPVVDEEADLKREEEAVASASSRVNRKFRFGLALGGDRGRGELGESGASDASNDGAIGSIGAGEPAENGSGMVSADGGGVSPEEEAYAAAVAGEQDRSPPRPEPEKKQSYKDATFEKTINAPVVMVGDLRRLSWNGIPPKHRPQAWKILLGYLPANSARRKQTLERKRSEYRDAIATHYDIDDNTRTMQEQETLRQVLVDVPRTAPDIALFRDNRLRPALGRLLYIWACRHPASSYVQGINDLATPLISVFLSSYCNEDDDVLGGKMMDDITDDQLFEVEADTYWCLTNLLAGIQDHYTADQPGVQRMVMRLEELVARIDADLTQHLRETGIEFFQFAFKWMNCLLLREFTLPCVMRLWDTYLSEADGGFEDFHVYVCAAFLCQFSAEVRSMQFDELFGFMQNMPTRDWGDSEVEIVLSQAYVLSTLFDGSDAHLISQNR
mmetsp:Transcript_2119/g.6113  ORF Transcript_2119/g.6113 Transcript_2119/m.6113 type:complete len:521 (+) Transcript_2119:265-1827(+)